MDRARTLVLWIRLLVGRESGWALRSSPALKLLKGPVWDQEAPRLGLAAQEALEGEGWVPGSG